MSGKKNTFSIAKNTISFIIISAQSLRPTVMERKPSVYRATALQRKDLAFTTQCNVNGVYGKGFDDLKVKMKPANNNAPVRRPAHSPETSAHIPPKI